MNITIIPSKIKGKVTLPASKSAMHRAIIAASLAHGKSIIKNASFNDDTTSTLKAFIAWGINYSFMGNTLEIIGKPQSDEKEVVIDCMASGSTLRLLIPLFSKIHTTKYIGDKYLFTRPLDIYKEIYEENNLTFTLTKEYLETSGQVPAGNYQISKAVSSQFISGLLFYLPLQNKDSTIFLDSVLSRPYIDLSIDYIRKAGVKIVTNGKTIEIPGNQEYKAFTDTVEGDLSQLGYFLALGAFSGPIEVKNINFNSTQGDKKIIDVFKDMNAKMKIFDDSIIIEKSELNGFTYDLKDTPDLGLILFAMASLIDDVSRISNVKGLIYKECNRLEVGLKIVSALGGEYFYDEEKDTVEIRGTSEVKNIDEFDSYNDHRVIFTLAAISPLLSSPIKITNANHITKSYPTFWDDFTSLGGRINNDAPRD